MAAMNTGSEVLKLKETVRLKGRPVTLDALRITRQIFLVTGSLLRVAELKHYFEEDVIDPEAVVCELKRQDSLRVDILKFRQRIPETAPKYPYFREWRDVAAIPITTHKEWIEKQISKGARNRIRKAAKEGIVVKEDELSESLVRGIMEIYNESPVRRGKPFWHYRKAFDIVKSELSLNLEKSVFLVAYDQGEVVGFIKLLIDDRFARTTLLLDKLSRRGKSPSVMNSLFSKAVEVCAERHIPYLVYSVWRRGTHGDFQERNGFVKIAVPEYFVPVTARGRFALHLRLHQGLRGWIPERMMVRLLAMRKRWYAPRMQAQR